MSNRKSFDKVEKGIKAGAYKVIRLLKKEAGKEDQTVFPWNKIGSVEERFAYIKLKLDELPTGEYEIECRTSHTAGIPQRYPIEIKDKQYISFTHSKDELKKLKPDQPETPEIMANEVDFDDYVSLIKEVEKLKAQNAVLLTQLEMERNNKSLNDAPPGAGVMAVINDHLPLAMNILDKFLSQRDKQLDLKDRELSLEENGRSGHGKKKVKRIKQMAENNKEVTREEILESFQALSESDEAAFENELNALEQKDPELYDYICEEMGLFDDGEEEEETE
jgi:hypothetical protein